MLRSLKIAVALIGVTLVAAGCGRKSSHNPLAPTSTDGTGTSFPSVQTITIGGIGSGGGESLVVGQSCQLTAKARLSDGAERDITLLATWATDDDGVVSVTTTGLVTARRGGMGRVRASYEQASGLTSVEIVEPPATDPDSGTTPDTGGTPPPPPGTPSPAPGPGVPPAPNLPVVQSLTITGSNTVPAGRSVQLRAVATMSDGSQKDVTGSSNWSADNAIIAIVTQSGVLTGLAPGSNVARASYNGTSASYPITVTAF